MIFTKDLAGILQRSVDSSRLAVNLACAMLVLKALLSALRLALGTSKSASVIKTWRKQSGFDLTGLVTTWVLSQW